MSFVLSLAGKAGAKISPLANSMHEFSLNSLSFLFAMYYGVCLIGQFVLVLCMWHVNKINNNAKIIIIIIIIIIINLHQ